MKQNAVLKKCKKTKVYNQNANDSNKSEQSDMRSQRQLTLTVDVRKVREVDLLAGLRLEHAEHVERETLHLHPM